MLQLKGYGSVASSGSGADEPEAQDLRARSTLIDGLDALVLVVVDVLAAKETRKLTSDLLHFPEDCEQLVEPAERLACESHVELSEWDARVDETAHKVVIIHAYMLVGLLAAIVLASILSAWSVGGLLRWSPLLLTKH